MSATMQCPSCGAELPDTARFCGSCGQMFQETRAPGGREAVSDVVVHAPALTKSADLGTGSILAAAFEKSMPAMGPLIVGTIALGIVCVVAVVSIIGWFALPALSSGFVVAGLLAAAGRPIAIGDFFKGMRLFVPLLLLGIVAGFITSLGFMVLVVPGLYLAIVWSLAPYIMIDRGLDFWPSMELSRQTVHAHFVEVIIFSIVIGVLDLVVSSATGGIGSLVTVPFTMVAYAVLYDRVLGIEGGAERL